MQTCQRHWQTQCLCPRQAACMAEDDADGPAVRDDEKVRAGMARQQIVPRPEHARLKGGEALTAGWRVVDGIVPESFKAIRVCGENLGRGFAFPIAEVNLAQARVDVGIGHVDFSETPASANVAISLCRAQASRRIGTATAAPLPSPRRMPRSSSGFSLRASNMQIGR